MCTVELGAAVEVVRAGAGDGRVLLSVEHASQRLPAPWRWSLADARLRGTHWAFDLGAADLARELTDALGTVAVLARFSRLVIDANRPLASPTLIRAEAEGQPIELGVGVPAHERALRIERLHAPFHTVLGRELGASRAEVLLGVHSFTPVYEGAARQVELGVLFNRDEALGRRLCEHLAPLGFDTRPNEPYSGMQGLMHSVHAHAHTHGRSGVEIEVRQDLCVDRAVRRRLVERLADLAWVSP